MQAMYLLPRAKSQEPGRVRVQDPEKDPETDDGGTEGDDWQ